MSKGKFIVFEGPDGSGKSTQARLLHRRLTGNALSADAHPAVWLTAEPTDGPIGALLRDMLVHGDIYNDITSDTMALLFGADRSHHVSNLIEPMLAEGDIVISDRYYLSTFVYQTAAEYRAYRRSGSTYDREVFERRCRWLQAVMAPHPTPDMTVILLPPVSVLAARLEKRGAPPEKFENTETLEAVHSLYSEPRQFIGGERFVILQATGTDDEVAEEVLAVLKKEEII
jgi:dTMP kinase